jgi:hypothetical protein
MEPFYTNIQSYLYAFFSLDFNFNFLFFHVLVFLILRTNTCPLLIKDSDGCYSWLYTPKPNVNLSKTLVAPFKCKTRTTLIMIWNPFADIEPFDP